jgi:hypothetical protein
MKTSDARAPVATGAGDVYPAEGVDVTDHEAKRFVAVSNGLAAAQSLNDIAESVKIAHYSGDPGWDALFAVWTGRLVHVTAMPVASSVDDNDYIHEDLAMITVEPGPGQLGARHFGTIGIRIDGWV